ncbi:hypothetical protein DFA_00560 [Cavenderia fasciculata]|uniref:Uncharacterized protein n=1 Tax=Cavenderia fasciculata TaxID=261658 RepID=F4PSK7_CACFS|nr:uncharacterized protein DFA_00560 [Cavenderia fasciculata]EGG20699.1 hypothetical protein DFA_00560 [Cavenderia fasciculata]|eukprot:XP_004358549.1 hypothetical protein DFA_00560 [Cavenderia fasciculata]
MIGMEVIMSDESKASDCNIQFPINPISFERVPLYALSIITASIAIFQKVTRDIFPRY